MATPYEIQIETYQGPLDLLLDLIRKQEINLYDIPVAQITGQYLDYLNRNLPRLDTEVAGEFLLMASTLIHIKSKMLLPTDPTQEEELEDPRADLVHQLLEHEKFRQAAQMLQQKQMLQSSVWSAPDIGEFLDPEAEPDLAVSLIDLVKAFQKVHDRAKARQLMDIAEETISVGEMMRQLCDLLASREKPCLLGKVLEKFRSREAILAAFLALLELIRLQAVAVRQNALFSDIELRKYNSFSATYAKTHHHAGKDYR
jgi:segregation and condensation protein A